MKNDKIKKETELRNNLLSGDWIIIAPTRAGRIEHTSTKCPFCHLEEQEIPLLIYNNGRKVANTDKWTTIVFSNKYPVFIPSVQKSSYNHKGCYRIKSPGHHELIITADHKKKIYELPIKRIKEVFDCYQSRILDLKKEKSAKYIFVFQNSGEKAGASQKHPHSQIITIPFIDKELKQTLSNSRKYFSKNKKCLHCEIIKEELKIRERIITENKSFIAYIPFAPKFIYQTIIAPKKHNNMFENISDEEKLDLAEIFKIVLKKFSKKLDDPAYNFYLNNSPCDSKDYNFFHWYFTLMPRITNLAGFEIGANMEILTKLPEDQAKLLK